MINTSPARHPLLSIVSRLRLSQITLILAIVLLPDLVLAQARTYVPFVGTTLDGDVCQYSGSRSAFDGSQTISEDYLMRGRPDIAEYLRIVEKAHFKPEHESLQANNAPENLGYTLRRFPNHHRALVSLTRYDERVKRSGDPLTFKAKTGTNLECWYNRAIAFRPKDLTTNMLFAIFLHKQEKFELAESQYKNALKIAPKNPGVHYNLGLLYVDMGRYQEAQKHADIAYSAGYELPGLRRRLENINTGDTSKMDED